MSLELTEKESVLPSGASRSDGPPWMASPVGRPSHHHKGAVALAVPRQGLAQMAGLSKVISGHGYAPCQIASDFAADLEAGLGDPAIRLVVLHIDLVDVLGLPHLMRVRRHWPATDWMLAWHGRVPRLVELLIRMRARGSIDLGDLSNATASMERVMAGQLSLPRWVLHDMYSVLLDERRARALDLAQADELSGPALTRREAAALDLMHQGFTNPQIGARLQISVSTVKKHLKNAFDKRGLNSRRQALG